MSLDYYIKNLIGKYEDKDMMGNPITLYNKIVDGDYQFDVIEEKKGGNGNGKKLLEGVNGNSGNNAKNGGGRPCTCGGVMRKTGGNCFKCQSCGSEDGGCGGG